MLIVITSFFMYYITIARNKRNKHSDTPKPLNTMRTYGSDSIY